MRDSGSSLLFSFPLLYRYLKLYFSMLIVIYIYILCFFFSFPRFSWTVFLRWIAPSILLCRWSSWSIRFLDPVFPLGRCPPLNGWDRLLRSVVGRHWPFTAPFMIQVFRIVDPCCMAGTSFLISGWSSWAIRCYALDPKFFSY